MTPCNAHTASPLQAWLETHIWHAKRFHVEDLWGYRVPVRPSEKSVRAHYRWAHTHATLHDLSYACWVEMSGPAAAVLRCINRLMAEQWVAPPSPSRAREVLLFSPPGADGQRSCLGPATALWVAASTPQLWLCVHPSADAAVIAAASAACMPEQVCWDGILLIAFARLRCFRRGGGSVAWSSSNVDPGVFDLALAFALAPTRP